MMRTILVVEDNEDIQQLLTETLARHGFRAVACSGAAHALETFAKEAIDLVLLDVQLPDGSGFDVCERLRTISAVPILFLSCMDDGSDIIRGLELGGDDYITKPFDLHELIARIRSNLRRTPAARSPDPAAVNAPREGEIVTVGPLAFHPYAQKAMANGAALPLSTKEYQILSFLAQRPGGMFSAHELYELLWGENSLGETRTLKVHISNLRRKLEVAVGPALLIRNVRGFGYQFVIGEDHSEG